MQHALDLLYPPNNNNNNTQHSIADLLSSGCLLPTSLRRSHWKIKDPLQFGLHLNQNEFRPDPRCHRGLRQVPENFVYMDLFTPDPPRLPHDGEHLYWSNAAPSLPRELQLGSLESILLPRFTKPQLQSPGFFLLLFRRPAADQPDWAHPMWPRMGVQQGDFPKYNCHRGERRMLLMCHFWKMGF